MAPTVRLAPRAALERLPVPDALLRFLAEQGLDLAHLRGTCQHPDVAERLERLGLRAGDDLTVLPLGAARSGVSFDPGSASRALLVDHRLRVTPGGPVALTEAWLAERHGSDPAGDDGDGLRIAASLDGSPAGEGSRWEVLAVEQRVLEQALTLEDLASILSGGQVQRVDLGLRARAGAHEVGFVEVESVLTTVLLQRGPR